MTTIEQLVTQRGTQPTVLPLCQPAWLFCAW